MKKLIRHGAWQAVQGFALLFGFPVLAPVFRTMAVVAVHGLGYGNNRSHAFSGEEWFVRHVLVQAKVRTCIDVGANVGQYAMLLTKHVPGPIYSLEPLQSSFDALVANAHTSVHPLRYAVSDTDGEVQIFSRKEKWEGATLHHDLAGESAVAEVVPAITIDTLVKKHNLNNVDFVKIDTEGHELEVLKGMQGLLRTASPKYLQIEFGGAHLKRGHTIYHFQQLLPGYQLYRLMSHGMVRVNPSDAMDNFFMFSNVIAVHAGVAAKSEQG